VGIDGKDQDNGPLILLQLQNTVLDTARKKGLSCFVIPVINREKFSVSDFSGDVRSGHP
jgi:hypothetical protein